MCEQCARRSLWEGDPVVMIFLTARVCRHSGDGGAGAAVGSAAGPAEAGSAARAASDAARAAAGTSSTAAAAPAAEDPPSVADLTVLNALVQLLLALRLRLQFFDGDLVDGNPSLAPGDSPVFVEWCRICQSITFALEALKKRLPAEYHDLLLKLVRCVPLPAEFHFARSTMKAVCKTFWPLLRVFLTEMFPKTKSDTPAHTDYNKVAQLFGRIIEGTLARLGEIRALLSAAETEKTQPCDDPAIAFLQHIFFELLPLSRDLRRSFESGNFDEWRSMLPRAWMVLHQLGKRYAGHVLYWEALFQRLEVDNVPLYDAVSLNSCVCSEMPVELNFSRLASATVYDLTDIAIGTKTVLLAAVAEDVRLVERTAWSDCPDHCGAADGAGEASQDHLAQLFETTPPGLPQDAVREARCGALVVGLFRYGLRNPKSLRDCLRVVRERTMLHLYAHTWLGVIPLGLLPFRLATQPLEPACLQCGVSVVRLNDLARPGPGRAFGTWCQCCGAVLHVSCVAAHAPGGTCSRPDGAEPAAVRVVLQCANELRCNAVIGTATPAPERLGCGHWFCSLTCAQATAEGLAAQGSGNQCVLCRTRLFQSTEECVQSEQRMLGRHIGETVRSVNERIKEQRASFMRSVGERTEEPADADAAVGVDDVPDGDDMSPQPDSDDDEFVTCDGDADDGNAHGAVDADAGAAESAASCSGTAGCESGDSAGGEQIGEDDYHRRRLAAAVAKGFDDKHYQARATAIAEKMSTEVYSAPRRTRGFVRQFRLRSPQGS